MHSSELLNNYMADGNTWDEMYVDIAVGEQYKEYKLSATFRNIYRGV